MGAWICSSSHGEKGLDSGYILKVDGTVGFVDGLTIRCEKKGRSKV